MSKSLNRPPASAAASARPDEHPGATPIRAARAQISVARGQIFRPINLERRARFARIEADATRGG
ncbi:hypothetical protein DSM21852_10210 [Methylocystis bryophila]|uniref:Uncharacterized protein n=1 Tax=Methylocystis bryophila TaxID=655015 RepID=A0A1W6MW08_9HYPH|nr:hypothetical protein B1812_12240 [Methylocystis bryophila]BDV37768.1 hypothetical protein DSM21852_10210 [Methylocystis bryophila]